MVLQNYALYPHMSMFDKMDDVARPAQCDAITKGAPPNSVRVTTYPNTYHAFDVHSLPQRAQQPFGKIGYNAEATTGSWAMIRDLLR